MWLIAVGFTVASGLAVLIAFICCLFDWCVWWLACTFLLLCCFWLLWFCCFVCVSLGFGGVLRLVALVGVVLVGLWARLGFAC